MGIVEFSEEKGPEFGGYEDMLVVRTFRNIKNALIEMIGKDKADQVIDEYTLDALQADAMADETKPGTCSACGMPCAECTCSTTSTQSTDYNEGGSMLTKEQLEARERELNQREQTLNAKEIQKKHGENIAFCEGLVQAGKLLPAQKAAAIAALDFAEGVATPAANSGVIEFGEGEAKKSQTPAEIIKSLLNSQPKQIDFSEYDFSEGSEPGKQAKGQIPNDINKFV